MIKADTLHIYYKNVIFISVTNEQKSTSSKKYEEITEMQDYMINENGR